MKKSGASDKEEWELYKVSHCVRVGPGANNRLRTMILSRRPKDDDVKDGFTNWPFMTTHTWGENPIGKWRLIARFQGPGKHRGTLKKFSLMLHGTKEPPYAGIEPLLGHVNSKLQVVQTAHKRISP